MELDLLHNRRDAFAMNPNFNPTSVLNQLREQIRHVESGSRVDDGDVVKNGCEAIDRLLPQHGYPRGTLVQWITGGGHGADYLSLRVAQQACVDGGALVVIDPLNQFFPPAAAAMGINLDHLIVLHSGPKRSTGAPNNSIANSELSHQDRTAASQGPVGRRSHTNNSSNSNDLLWAIDQSLRCPAVAAVWGPIAEINDRWFRRFQLSAESSGCVGLFIQPPSAARRPTWAEVQWLVGMNVAEAASRSPAQTGRATPYDGISSPSKDTQSPQLAASATKLQLARCRGTQTGKSIHITIDSVTGEIQSIRRPYEQLTPANKNAATPAHRLPVAAQLADPATGRRTA